MTLVGSEIEVVGRDAELAAVRDFLEAGDRLPRALVIEGEGGIGKTTLWRAALASADQFGYRVLSTRPAQSESQASYAGLADLLDTLLEDALPELPAPQRRALEAALLLRDAGDDKPEQTAIAFGFLGALRGAARESAVLVAVDDFQWLDAPSHAALVFAARRLREDQVGFVFTVRPEIAGERALELGRLLGEERTTRVEVGSLSFGAMHRLIQVRLGIVLTRPTLRRLYETSRGNPFFALELARALAAHGEQLRPGDALPVGGELRQLLRARLSTLPDGFHDVLLVAAAVPEPTTGLVAEATGSDPSAILEKAVDAELVELDGARIRFTHPLVASGVYAEASADRKREVHGKLAAIVTDVEERARHAALATVGADAAAASVLDQAAEKARARGAPQAAAELSELALRLTPHTDSEAAHRRRVDAGLASFEAGDAVRARTLFAEAAELARGSPLRAEALGRLAWVHHYAGDQRVAIELFRECLSDRHADVLVHANAAEGLATSFFFLREEFGEALAHARSAARLAEQAASRSALAAALGAQGMLEAVLGRKGADRTLRSGVAIEQHARELPLGRQPSFQLAFTRVWGDDLGAAREALDDIRQRAIDRGDEGSLPFVLSYLALAEYLTGRFQEAMRVAEEGEHVALAAGLDTGRAFPLAVRALVASGLGREDASRSDAAEALSLAEQGSMFAASTSLWALGLLELSLDRPRAAHEHLGALVERVEAAGIGEPGSVRFVTDDVEALLALGELDRAATQLERFEARARRLHRRTALAPARRCRGLLALAEGLPEKSVRDLTRTLDELARVMLPLDEARTLLALGAAQRHARQRRAARETLEHAVRRFDELGASLWAERARAELRRISGRAPSSAELTPSEERVAALVAEGRTNREVANELFVTPRTVEGTLSSVYAKLGVRSRTQLARYWASRRS
jgi:DNA-binding NarL/FixJ family response regulator